MHHFFTLVVVLFVVIEQVFGGFTLRVRTYEAYHCAGHTQPLKRVAHPSTVALEILPRRNSNVHARSTKLRFDDSFRLTISAFDETFHLHLRPNEHLIHPAARIHYYDANSRLTETKPLLRETVKAYWGEVIHENSTHSRLREDAATVVPPPPTHPSVLGWARIVVHHQGNVDAPVYEGAFSANGVIHHVTTRDNYLRNKHPMDPAIDRPFIGVDSALVIWRETDIVDEMPLARTCAHDSLSFNVDPMQNPILQRRRSPTILDIPPFSNLLGVAPFSNLSRGLVRRDDVVGNSTTSK